MNVKYDQKITLADFKKALVQSELVMNDAEIKEVFNGLDENKNGYLLLPDVFKKLRVRKPRLV